MLNRALYRRVWVAVIIMFGSCLSLRAQTATNWITTYAGVGVLKP
ncbi:MAG TPA: hypothetical protein VGK48_12955 [Terriglobia bacterium]